MKQATRFTVQRGWSLILADMGLSPAAVLRLAGLPADLFVRPDASLSAPEYFRLWQGLEEAAGGDSLPLRLGQAVSVEAFDPPLFACLCSPHLNAGLQRLDRFKRLIGPISLGLDITERQTAVSIHCYGNDQPIPRSLGLAELVFFTALARLATRQTVKPLRVEVAQLPDDTAPYRDYFGVPLQAGPVNRITFAGHDARLPFLTENAAMWDCFEAGLNQRLSRLDAEATMAQRVRAVLLEMLPGGDSSIDEVARRLALSRRSLQRKLGEESVGFQEVLDGLRLDLARHYLRQATVSPGEIAYLLGFQDGNSFLRAFKGWTGQTPGAFRTAQHTAAA